METWLKCNRCFREMRNSSKQFYVTQCQHVFCSVCIGKAREQCWECHAVGSEAIVLEKSMPPQMAHFFAPLSAPFDKALQAASFQKTQFMIIMRRASQTDEKYANLKKSVAHASQHLKQLSAAYNELRRELTNLQLPDEQSSRQMEISNIATPDSSSRDSPFQQRITSESSKNPGPPIFTHSRSSTQHRESQHGRAIEYAPSRDRESQMSTQIVNHRYDAGPQLNERQRRPRTQPTQSRSYRTVDEEIRRRSTRSRPLQSMDTSMDLPSSSASRRVPQSMDTSMNLPSSSASRRVPQSMDTSLNLPSSGYYTRSARNTANATPRNPNYDLWNMRPN